MEAGTGDRSRASRYWLGRRNSRSNGKRGTGYEASGVVVVLATSRSTLTGGYRPSRMAGWAGQMGHFGLLQNSELDSLAISTPLMLTYVSSICQERAHRPVEVLRWPIPFSLIKTS